MFIAIQGIKDFAYLSLYISGIHFDFWALIFDENFHRHQRKIKIRSYQEGNGKLFLAVFVLAVGSDNFFHQLMTDDILG